MKFTTAFGGFVGLASANFLWQAFGAGDFALALDRSYFQGVAIFGLYAVNWLFDKDLI